MAAESVTEFVLRITGARPGLGSGFVCGTTETGTLIVTCDHVVEDLGEPLLVGGREATVRVRGRDVDLAVLEIEREPAWVTLQRAAPVRGAKVVVVGWHRGDQGDSAESRRGTVDDLTQLTYPATAKSSHRGLVAALERPIERGYSGGPVIAVSDAVTVVGVLRWRQGDDRAHATDAREIEALLTGLVTPPPPPERKRSWWSLAVPIMAAIGVWWWIQRSDRPPRAPADCGMPTMALMPDKELRAWCPRARAGTTVPCRGSSRDGTVTGACDDQLPRGVWESRTKAGALLWHGEVGRAGKDQPVRIGAWDVRSPFNADRVIRSTWRAMCSSPDFLARLAVDCAGGGYTRETACDGTSTWTVAAGGVTLGALTDATGDAIGTWTRTGSSTETLDLAGASAASRRSALGRLREVTAMLERCDAALIRVPSLTRTDAQSTLASILESSIALRAPIIQQAQFGPWCERSTVDPAPVHCEFDSLDGCQRDGDADAPGTCFLRPSVLFCYPHYARNGDVTDRCLITSASCDAHRRTDERSSLPCAVVPMLAAGP